MPGSDTAPLRAMLRSRRLASVALLSFASGLPLGIVWNAVPAWMTQAGVDIKVVGLFSLAQAPWTFKVLWAPFVDRYPLPLLGRKRGWMVACQLALAGLGLGLAAASRPPEPVGVIGALCLATALASATLDIAYDGYTVEVLRREEHGLAVGARLAFYRTAMWISGRLAITLAGAWTWASVNTGLALLYLPTIAVAWLAPDPEDSPQALRTLREAVWQPFVGLLAQHRALEILAFVVLFKLSDNLTQALTGPFLIQTGFSLWDVGVGHGTVGLIAIVLGTFAGGLLSQARGLGAALWISGLLQVFSNLGYALVASVGTNRPVMYAATAFEYLTTGLGSGALGVMLLRLTQKRFSATQFALLSSLFTIPRVLAGPAAGMLADALGWRDFFVLTLLFGVPGLVMLQRFVPWGVREPEFHLAPPRPGAPVGRAAVAACAALAALLAWSASLLVTASLGGIKAYRAGRGFQLSAHLEPLLAPSALGDWLTAAGLVALALGVALATAATLVARRGMRDVAEA
jgi:PAT family beta-lactamase induction signal transducer AmpG